MTIPATTVVTGASGYVATELVKQLLSDGYTVRATVRSTKDPARNAFLTKLGDALPGKLELHEADLLKDGSFDKIVEGAKFVFHTASPFFNPKEGTNKEEELVKPAVQGTLNVLRSVAAAGASVRRVVLTSSCAAIMKAKAGPNNGHTFTDEDWNTDATLEEATYPYSKTEAEKAAWKFAKEKGIDLVTIHPVFVMGPIISDRTDATSVETMIAVLEGKRASFGFPYIAGVADIGLAHIRAAQIPEAKGRYIVSADEALPSEKLLALLADKFPGIQLAEPEPQPLEGFLSHTYSTERTRAELGMAITPAWINVVNMSNSLIAKGLAKPTFK